MDSFISELKQRKFATVPGRRLRQRLLDNDDREAK